MARCQRKVGLWGNTRKGNVHFVPIFVDAAQIPAAKYGHSIDLDAIEAEKSMSVCVGSVGRDAFY
jgi:hypothetical protein